MELSGLTGIHYLSGVETGKGDFENICGYSESCQFIMFTLDGIHYLAVEDPDDGYRSHCRELVTSDVPPMYSFPPQQVYCSMKEGENDILVMKDTGTDDVVLEVGTCLYDHYYPYCHFEYHPEAMSINNPEVSQDAFKRILGYQ